MVSWNPALHAPQEGTPPDWAQSRCRAAQSAQVVTATQDEPLSTKPSTQPPHIAEPLASWQVRLAAVQAAAIESASVPQLPPIGVHVCGVAFHMNPGWHPGWQIPASPLAWRSQSWKGAQPAWAQFCGMPSVVEST
jgi:hypothetical protein